MGQNQTQPSRSQLIRAIEQQQKMLTRQAAAIDTLQRRSVLQATALQFLVRLSGTTKEVTALLKQADVLNPGQPVPDPAAQGPAESSEQARTPEAEDDVQNLGLTPGSTQKVPAEQVDQALNPGASIPTEPYNQLVDVTAPVAGTETHVPNDQTRLDLDVRVGNPDDPNPAFPWVIPGGAENTAGDGNPAAEQEASRSMASMRLARLRVQAGLATDDLAEAGRIESSRSSISEINQEIAVLGKVAKAASTRRAPGGLVPRSASGQRSTPSLAEGAPLRAYASVDDETADADLFM